MLRKTTITFLLFLVSANFLISQLVSYSTYNLLYLGYSDEWVKDFIYNSANAGSDFIRIMSMMDLSQRPDSWAKEWVFSPWKEDFTGWDESYFKRLKLIVDEAKKYNVKILYSIYVAQENPLSNFGVETKLRLLADLVNEVKKYGIKHWELINEGSPDLTDKDGEKYIELVRGIRYLLSEGVIHYSGEMAGTLSPYYHVYMPHNWGGELSATLGGDEFNNPETLKYLEHLKSDYKKLILPSSDGCKPVATLENFVKIWEAVRDRGYIGWEMDIGWFYEDGKFDWKVAELSSQAFNVVFGRYPENYHKYSLPSPPPPKPTPEPTPKPTSSYKKIVLVLIAIIVVVVTLIILRIFGIL